MPSVSYTLAANGSSPIIPITPDMLHGSFMLPNLLCIVSSGASLTYVIEQTGDNIQQPGYTPAAGNWTPLNGLSGQTASQNSPLGACATALRATMSNYVSGSLTFQFIWAGSIT